MLIARSIRGRRPRKQLRHYKFFFGMGLFLLILFLCLQWMEVKLAPSLLAIAESRAKMKITEIVNSSVKAVIRNMEISTDDLLTYNKNEAGVIVSFGVNTMVINELTGEILQEINRQFEQLGIYEVSVPFGNVLNYHFFANVGPRITTRILPIGAVEVDYQREVLTAGINQVQHRIWIQVDTNYQIIVPRKTDEYHYSQQITLVDRIISGTVPENYIYFPQGVREAVPIE